MIRAISYSLFDNYPCALNAVHIISACRVLFPSWVPYVYHDSSLLNASTYPFLQAMDAMGTLRLINRGASLSAGKAKLWRLLPAWEEQVEYFICRDFDSIETIRSRRAVEQFIATKAGLHAMNDCPAHCGYPVMAGMCGFKVSIFRECVPFSSWAACIDRFSDAETDTHNADQMFLMSEIWPRMKNVACEHRFSGEPAYKCGASWHTDLSSAPAVEDVPEKVQHLSDAVTNYIGACEYRLDDARKLYSEFLPADVQNALEVSGISW